MRMSESKLININNMRTTPLSLHIEPWGIVDDIAPDEVMYIEYISIEDYQIEVGPREDGSITMGVYGESIKVTVGDRVTFQHGPGFPDDPA